MFEKCYFQSKADFCQALIENAAYENLFSTINVIFYEKSECINKYTVYMDLSKKSESGVRQTRAWLLKQDTMHVGYLIKIMLLNMTQTNTPTNINGKMH